MIYKSLYLIFIPVLFLLLLIGCSQDETSIMGFGRSPFLQAVESGDTTAVRALLNKGTNPNEADDFGWSALMVAAGKGNTDIAKILIDKGAKVNSYTNIGWTALLRAANNQHPKTVELLITRGADVNAKTKNGMTALMYAAENGDIETAKALLAKYGINVNIHDNQGRTALSIAKVKKKPEMVALLKKYRAMD
jgi:uncharacterized protein